VTLDGNGTGTLLTAEPDCTAALSLVELTGATAVWRPSDATGRCAQGGDWRVKLVDGELAMTWLREGSDHFLAGRLRRLGS
jgi:hypothetical protein